MEDNTTVSYELKEKVLAFAKNMYYDAKILKINKTENGNLYFIHYQGWSKTWDEWVDDSRLAKKTLENEKKKEEIIDYFKARTYLTISNIFNRGSKTTSNLKIKEKKSNKSNSDQKEKEKEKQERQTKFTLPFGIKLRLSTDYANIVESKLLHPIPRKPCIDEILNDYVESNKQGGTRFIADLVEGLKCYFNKALPLILLYKSERNQYQQFQNSLPSSVYGAEHFFRLFVKLPELLQSYKGMTNKELQLLMRTFQDILNFVNKRDSYFISKSQYISSE